MKLFEYKIVDGQKQHVEKTVNELAQEGWSITGSIQVRTYDGGTLYTQVMVRQKEHVAPVAK